MKIGIINGPNLNRVGSREPEVYGNQSFEDYFDELESRFPDHNLSYFQSNLEGELINALQRMEKEVDGFIFNPGAYTHTSIALGDTVAACLKPVVEVHISNVQAREHFRQLSYIAPHAFGIISGFGLKGYEIALRALLLS